MHYQFCSLVVHLMSGAMASVPCQVAHTAGAYSVFCSTKLYSLRPRCDASPP